MKNKWKNYDYTYKRILFESYGILMWSNKNYGTANDKFDCCQESASY